jgi:acyl carrier protein
MQSEERAMKMEDTTVDESTGARQSNPHVQMIRDWLVAKLAEYLKIQPQEIDSGEKFQSYGLDSVTAVALAGELEDWLGRELPASVVYDHPTVEALARHLANEGPQL